MKILRFTNVVASADVFFEALWHWGRLRRDGEKGMAVFFYQQSVPDGTACAGMTVFFY
jgi:hypothetical protein